MAQPSGRYFIEGIIFRSIGVVNIKGTYKGQPVVWNTSLSRTDTGTASCELVYVSKVRIDTKIYEEELSVHSTGFRFTP